MFPWWLNSKESTCIAGDTGLTPGLGRSTGGRNGNPFLVFLPEKSHGQTNLMGCSPCDGKRVRHILATRHQLQHQVKVRSEVGTDLVPREVNNYLVSFLSQLLQVTHFSFWDHCLKGKSFAPWSRHVVDGRFQQLVVVICVQSVVCKQQSSSSWPETPAPQPSLFQATCQAERSAFTSFLREELSTRA